MATAVDAKATNNIERVANCVAVGEIYSKRVGKRREKIKKIERGNTMKSFKELENGIEMA